MAVTLLKRALSVQRANYTVDMGCHAGFSSLARWQTPGPLVRIVKS